VYNIASTSVGVVPLSEQFITSRELSKRLGLSYSYTKQLLAEGKVSGAIKIGRHWLIGSDAKPVKVRKLPTARAVAQRLGFSHSHMRRLIRDGKIKATKFGGEWIINNPYQIRYKRQRKAKGTL